MCVHVQCHVCLCTCVCVYVCVVYVCTCVHVLVFMCGVCVSASAFALLHVCKCTGMVHLSVNGRCDMKPSAQPSEEACSKYWQLYQYRIDLGNKTPVLAVLQVARRRFDGR